MTRTNFLWKLAGSLLGGGVYFVFSLVLIRTLGPENYGKYAFALGWSGLFSIFVDYGLNAIVTRDLAQNPAQGRYYLARVFRLKGALFIAAGAVLLAVSTLNRTARELFPLIFPAFLFLVSTSFIETAQAFSSAYERFRDGAFLMLTHKWLVAAAGFAGILLVWNVLSIAWAMAAAGIASLVPSFLYFARLLKPSGQALPVSPWELLREGWPLLLQNILIVICGRMDTVLLSVIRGNHETGLYSAAYRFFEVSSILPAAFVAAVSAGLARSVLEGRGREKFLRYSVPLLGMGFAGLLLLMAVSFFLPRFFLSENYAASGLLLRVLSLGLPLLYLNYLQTVSLTMLRRQAANAFVSAGGVTFNLLANLWAIPRWGALGAAVVLVLTQAVALLAGLLFLVAPFKKRSPVTT